MAPLLDVSSPWNGARGVLLSSLPLSLPPSLSPSLPPSLPRSLPPPSSPLCVHSAGPRSAHYEGLGFTLNKCAIINELDGDVILHRMDIKRVKLYLCAV